MKRKLIKQGGGGGLTIYVPKKWADKNRLKGGDEVEITPTDNDLLISSKPKEKEIKKITIQIEKQNKRGIRTIIASAYRRGYDEVMLLSKEQFSFLEINQIVDSLIGYVITEQENNRIIIKNVMGDKFEDVSMIINKLFMTTKFFIESMISYLEHKKGDKDELYELGKSIIKLRDYCQRMIHLTNYEGDKSYEYNILVFLIEKIAGENFQRFIEIKKINSNMITQLKKNQAMFTKLHECFMRKSLENAIKLNQELSESRKELYLDAKQHPLFCALTGNLFALSSRIVGILI